MDLDSVFWSSQRKVPEIGKIRLKSLASLRVLVIGLGGLGCSSLLYLTRSGFLNLGLVDGDHVEETNLLRQVLFTSDDLGKKKVDVAKKTLYQQMPFLKIKTWDQYLDVELGSRIFSQFDLILEGTDQWESKRTIHDLAWMFGKPLVSASALGREGQCMVFWRGKTPCFHCLYPNQDVTPVSCSMRGVLSSLLGQVGAFQVGLAIQVGILLNQYKNIASGVGGKKDHEKRSKEENQKLKERQKIPSFLKKLYLFDHWSLNAQSLFRKSRCCCPLCVLGKDPILKSSAFKNDLNLPNLVWDPSLLHKKDLLWIDVREEKKKSPFSHTVWIPFSKLVQDPKTEVKKLVSSCPPHLKKTYVCFCQSGKVSPYAAKIFFESGVRSVLSLKGGLAHLEKMGGVAF